MGASRPRSGWRREERAKSSATTIDAMQSPTNISSTATGPERDFSAALEMTIIVLAGPGFRVVLEVLAGGVVVAAAGLVVTAADGFVKGLSFGIDVKGEAALPAAVGAGVTGGGAGVFLEMIVVVHVIRRFSG